MNAGLGAGTARSRSPGQSLTGRQLSLVERPRKEGVRAKHCLTYALLTDLYYIIIVTNDRLCLSSRF